MNKKETIQSLELLDQCIDSVKQPEVLLALDDLRSRLMQLWEEAGCRLVDAAELLPVMTCLPGLCTEEEKHPSLPMKLCQVMFILCAPSIEGEQEMGRQCRAQAEKIRRLRQWRQNMAEVLVHYDEAIRQETEMLQAEQLAMMEEVYQRCLSIYRASLAETAAKLRSERMQVISRYRDALPLEEVADTAAQSRTISEMTKEKFSEFAADISASDALVQMTELPPQPTTHVPTAEKLPGTDEEEG